MGDYDNLPQVLDKCDELGIVTVMDLDDHWSPGPDHPAWQIIKQNELDKKISNNLRVSRNITTTTPVFADEIKKFNENKLLKALEKRDSVKTAELLPKHTGNILYVTYH